MKRFRICFTILAALLITICAVSVFASEDKEEIETCVRDYVEGLIRLQEGSNTAEVSSDQFETINGYIIATIFRIDREGHLCMSEKGIHNMEVKAFNIYSIEEIGSLLEVSVSVSYRYLFNGELECTAHRPYRVTVDHKNGKYKCVDIYTNEDDRVNEVMTEISYRGLKDKDSQIEYVDKRNEQTYRDMQASKPKEKVYRTMEEVFPYLKENDGEDTGRATSSTSVSYNATRAATYARESAFISLMF